MSRLRDKKMMMPFQKARVCMEVCRASFGETSTGGDAHTMETHVKSCCRFLAVLAAGLSSFFRVAAVPAAASEAVAGEAGSVDPAEGTALHTQVRSISSKSIVAGAWVAYGTRK